MAEDDVLATATLLRQYFAKHDAAQMANDLIIKETLGQGTYGRVRLAEFTDSCKAAMTEQAIMTTGVFALKMMKKSEVIRLKQTEHVAYERSLLRQINHPFIVITYRTYQDDRNLFMLMEYVQGGELGRHLRNEGTFANETARFYAAQLVMALQYLHADNIVYRGLVPENLLIDKIGYLKLVDFGYAKVVEDKTWTLCGTPEYLAPEVIQSKGHGKGVDWWALGILIYEMLAGYPPYYAESPFEIYQKILSAQLEFARHFDDNAKELLKRLLTSDRLKRIGCLKSGAEDIKKHKWFRGLNWAALYNKQMEAASVNAFVPTDANEELLDNDTSNYDTYPDSVEESGPLLNQDKNDHFAYWD